MEVHPENSLERFYSIVILLAAMLIFSSLLSGMTAQMTTLRQNNAERTRQAEYVRRYITDRKVSLELGNRIYNSLRTHGYVNKARILEGDVAAFKRLPENLMRDLHSEVFTPIVTVHVFFQCMSTIHEPGLIRICNTCMHETAVPKGKKHFTYGQLASNMGFVVRGSFLYEWIGESSASVSSSSGRLRRSTGDLSRFQEVGEAAYICEAVLWLYWEHQGQFEALGFSELLEIRSADFQTAASKLTAFHSVQNYAREWSRCCLSANMVSDLSSHGEESLVQDAFQDDLAACGQYDDAPAGMSRSRSLFATLSQSLRS